MGVGGDKPIPLCGLSFFFGDSLHRDGEMRIKGRQDCGGGDYPLVKKLGLSRTRSCENPDLAHEFISHICALAFYAGGSLLERVPKKTQGRRVRWEESA